MKKNLAVLLLLTGFNTISFCGNSLTANDFTAQEKNAILEKANKLTLPWIMNNGRQDARVAYYSNMAGGNLYLTKKGQLVYDICNVTPDKKGTQPALNRPPQKPEAINISGYVWRESFVNGKVNNIQPEVAARATVSYFIGNNPAKWENGKTTYYTLNLGQVWNKVEVKLNRNGNSIEKRFYIYQGGSINDIRLQMEGARDLKVSENGSLVIKSSLYANAEIMSFSAPVAYQYINGEKIFVPVHYSVHGQQYGFETGAYNPSYTLIIDPVLNALSASTYIGGSYYDYSNSITSDQHGNIYIASATLCTDYPTTSGAYQTHLNGTNNEDAYVSKFDANLSTLLASTYIGGTSSEQAMYVKVNNLDEVFITGQTFSSDYPTTAGAWQRTYGGGNFDDFIAKFNSNLTNLLASTYLGSSGDDLAYSIVFSNTNEPYFAGFTSSANFPHTAGAYQTAMAGNSDCFITKFDTSLTVVQASTFIGGSNYDYAYALVNDAVGNLYITGQTLSGNYPTVGSPYQSVLKGASDTYISKVNSSLTSLLASSYLGGSGAEQGNNITLDQNGNVYITGWESSSDFPVTAGAYQSTYGGGQNDAYISGMDNTCSHLVASTYAGGADDDYGYGLACDGSGNIYLSGFTGGNAANSNYPTTSGAFQTSYGGGYYDAFMSIFNTACTTLSESTLLGGSGSDFGYYLALSPSGDLYTAGQTQSTNFPTTVGAYRQNNAGAADVFVTKFKGLTVVSSSPKAKFVASDTTICKDTSVTFTDLSTNTPTSWVWTFTGGSPASSFSQNPSIVYSTPGTYAVKLVVRNSSGGDSITKTSYITVYPSTVPGTITGPDSVCSGTAVQLTASGNMGKLQWQSSSDGNSFANTATDTTSIYNSPALTQATYYRLNVTGACGTVTSPVFKVSVNPLPNPVLSVSDSVICYNDSARINCSGSYISYQWNNGDTLAYIYTNLAGGYWVTVTDANGCSASSASSAYVNIRVYPVSSVSIIVQQDTLSSYGAVSYQWLSDDTIIPGATSPVYIAPGPGSYGVQIVDTNGCTVVSNNVYVSVTGIQDIVDGYAWHIYPNPSHEYFFIKWDGGRTPVNSIEIMDLPGQIVWRKELEGLPLSEWRVDISALPRGMYYVKIETGKSKYLQKLIKQ